MTFHFDWGDPLGSTVVLLYNMVPAILPIAPGLTASLWARRLARVGPPALDTAIGGAGAASAILSAGGAAGRAAVVRAAGPLANFYDPARREVRLSDAVHAGRTAEALGIAAHEAGHALQDSQGYWLLRLRTPVVFGSRLGCGVAWLSILAGLLMLSPDLTSRGAVLYSAAVLALLILQPIERDANRRSREVQPLAGLDGESFRRSFEAAAWADVAALAGPFGGLINRRRFRRAGFNPPSEATAG